jgi:outer membrane protein assembly factor BamA
VRLGSFLLVTLTASAVWADEPPVQTWGGKPGVVDAPPFVPPEPPPGTKGTPIGGSTVAQPETQEDIPAPRAGRPGLRYLVESVEVKGNTSTLAKVILRHVPFKAGDTLDVDDPNLELVRYRLLGTGYFRDAQLSLRKGRTRGSVILEVNVVERNTIVINWLSLGVAADTDPSTGKARPLTAFGGIDVSENNLAGTGTILGAAMAVADSQLGLRTRVFVPQVLGSEWIVGGEALFNAAREFYGYKDVLVTDPTQKDPTLKQDFAIAAYKRYGGRLSLGHELGASTSLYIDYRLEGIDAQLPAAASHVRGLDREPIVFNLQPGTSVLSGLRATLVHDTRDEPLLTTRGWYVWLSSDAAFAPIGSDYNFFKIQGRVTRFIKLPWKHTLALEAYGGAVFGNAPIFELFYVGDYTDLLPDRLLDLAFDRRSAPNFFGSAIAQVRYGEYAARISSEYRVPIYRGQKAIYGADLFGSVGLYGLATPREFTDPARGYTDFAKVPIDFTFNFGLRVDTAIGGVSFGLSTLFGFIPVKGGGP